MLHDLDYATLKNLTQYLNNCSRACKKLDIEPSTLNKVGRKRQPTKQQQPNSRPNQFTSIPGETTTDLHEQAHYIVKCPEFLKFSVDQRAELVKQHKQGFNCFGQHRLGECISAFINNCGVKHHSTLHIDKKKYQNQKQKSNSMQFGTIVTRSSKQAKDPIENMSLSVRVYAGKTF